MMPNKNKKRARSQMLPDCSGEFDLETPLTNAEAEEWMWGERQAAALSAAQTYKYMLIEKLLTIEDLLVSLKAEVEFTALKRDGVKGACFDPYYSKQNQRMFFDAYTQYMDEGIQGVASVVAHLGIKAKVQKSLEQQEAVIAKLTRQCFKK